MTKNCGLSKSIIALDRAAISSDRWLMEDLLLVAREALAALRAEITLKLPLRQGTWMPVNIYDADGKTVCQCHCPEHAALIVAAVNAHAKEQL